MDTFALLLAPLVLAGGVAWLTRKFGWLAWATLLFLVSSYPLGHWYLMRSYRDAFYHLNHKDEVVADSLSAVLMKAEVVICVVIFLGCRFIAERSKARS